MSSASMSAFSEAEIVQELAELGILLPPEELGRLKHELETMLQSENFDAHSDRASGAPPPTTDAVQVLQNANRLHEKINEDYDRDWRSMPPDASPELVIKHAKELSVLVHKDIARIDAVLSTLSRMSTDEGEEEWSDRPMSFAEAELNQTCSCVESPCAHQLAVHALRDALRADGASEEDIDSTLMPESHIRDYQKALAKLKSDPLSFPTLRPLASVGDYGRLAYKSDPVARHQLYERCWKRNPVPGEKKRQALRWKVREYMLTHDCFMK